MIMQCLIIKGWPLIENLENWMALFNEFMVSAYLFVSMALTGFNTNSFYNYTGIALMSVILCTAGVNFLNLFISIIKIIA